MTARKVTIKRDALIELQPGDLVVSVDETVLGFLQPIVREIHPDGFLAQCEDRQPYTPRVALAYVPEEVSDAKKEDIRKTIENCEGSVLFVKDSLTVLRPNKSGTPAW